MPATEDVHDSISAIEDLISKGLWNQAENLCLAALKSNADDPELESLFRTIRERKVNPNEKPQGGPDPTLGTELSSYKSNVPDESGKYVAHYIMYTYDTFLEESLESVYPHVDKILIARTLKPGYGNPVDMTETEQVIKRVIERFGDKIELYTDEFPDEQTQRNFLLELSKSRRHSGAFIVDCDEVFVGDAFSRIYSFIKQNDPQALRIPYLTFIKDASFCVAPPYETNLFYVKIVPEARFSLRRKCVLPESVMPYDRPEILHFSYIRENDQEVWNKLTTFSHAKDIDWSKWYKEIYLGFNLNLKNFHPIWPDTWKRLELFDVKLFHQGLFDKLLKNGHLAYYRTILNRKELKLHLGCGPNRLEGYVNIDLYDPSADLKLDIVHLDYFPNDSVDEIFMNAVLEHLWSFEQSQALKEWKRVLKPGGRLIIRSIPDFDVIAQAYVNKGRGNVGQVFDLYNVYRYTHGDPTDQNKYGQIHKDIFTKAKVRQLLNSTGFRVESLQNVRWMDEPVECNIDVTATALKLGKEETEELIRDAEADIAKGDLAAADSKLVSILGFDDSNVDLLNDLAVVKLLEGKHAEAIEFLKKAAAIDPHNPAVKENIQIVLRALNEAFNKLKSGNQAAGADGPLETAPTRGGRAEAELLGDKAPDKTQQPVRTGQVISSNELSVFRVNSSDEHQAFISGGGPVIRSVNESIGVRLNDGASYLVDGYCWICKEASRFLVDTKYPLLVDERGIAPNFRERLTCVQCGNNNRIRAFVHFVESVFHVPSDSKIYLTEQTTSLFKYFMSEYGNTIGSEYLASAVPLGHTDARGVRNEDLTRLTFGDNEFDFVFSLEVLEHIPNFKSALREVLRVLKPTGKFVFTVPFLTDSDKTVVRATIENGTIRHILPPEYHGDPLHEEGCLCYQQFSWDLLNELRGLGFDDAAVFMVHSESYGYLGTPHLILVAQKEGKIVSPEQDQRVPRLDGNQIGLSIAAAPAKERVVSDTDRLYDMSQQLISENKRDEAAEVLQEILASDPSNTKALNDLAVLYSFAGRLPESIDLLNKLLQIDPTNIIAGKNLGSICLRANKVAEALNSYYRVLQTAPRDAAALQAIADICLQLGKKEEAALFYQKVLDVDPQNLPAASRLAAIHKGAFEINNGSGAPRGSGDDATPAATSSQKLEQDRHLQGAPPSFRIQKEVSLKDRSAVKELYDMAQVFIGENRLEEAKAKLNLALEIEPYNTSCLNDLAVLSSVTKDNDAAIEMLARLLKVDPNNTVARKNLGNLYLQTNKLAEALGAFSEVLKLDPKNIESLRTVARICTALNRPQDANLFYARVLKTTQDPEILRETLMEIERIEFDQYQDTVRMKLTHPPASLEAAGDKTDGSIPMVSIILLVYNKLDFSKRCIESILSTVKYGNYEIVVTDNASTDGTYEFMSDLAGRIEHVRYVRNDSNLGFVGGCNTGVANAKGKYVILLNNDTIVNKGWLESLVEFAETTPDCGAVGSKLIYPNGRLQEAGGIVFSDGNGWNYGRGMNPYDPKYNFVREVDYISGASLMVRKDLWNEIGGLDDRFSPAYFEDSDLCFEVRKHGYKVYYQPKSSIVHFEGTTNGTDVNTGRKRYQVINRPKFVEKWKKELSQQYPNDPRLVEKASSRGITKRIFVADPLLPMFDRAAGSLHLLNILKTLRAMNFHVTFVSGYWSLKEYYKPILEDLGIETYAGDPDAMTFMGYTSPYRKIDYPQLFKEGNFDFALIDFWYHAEFYIPLLRKYSPNTTVIVDTEDVHFVREMREAAVKGDQELEKKALQNKQRELSVYGKADRLWVVTEEDRQALKKESVRVPIDIRPVIHELPHVKNDFESRNGILFVGNFNHRPNADAVEFFAKEVFPLVTKFLPEVKLHIVGNNSEKSVGSFASENVLVAGYVPDLAQYYNTCRVVVAPLRYGAGLKGKVVESLSYGVPVVTTSVGVEGTGLRDGSELMVADNPREMAERIISVYSNKEVWERLSTRGRAVMQKRWSVDAGRKRIEELMSLAAEKSGNAEEKLTSIVILTFNQLDYTKITIDSIRRHTKSPYEIIVVDNASSDGTAEYLKAQKDIRTIFNEQNVGFPAGCNQGIEVAKGDYLLLLNNDVIVTDDWLEGMIECSNVEPKVGIVGPMTNWISGFQLEKDIPYKKVSQMPTFAAKYRRRNRRKWIDVPRIAGFCMLIKRNVVETIGGLDTLFGIGNCEDDDYCLRAKLAGFKVALAGDVFIHHFGSKSFSQKGVEKYLNVVQSKEKLFQEKWGITPSEWWRDGKELTKMSELKIPLDHRETMPVMADEGEPTVSTEQDNS